MEMSEHVNELAAALAKAQGQIEGAVKDSANPFFKSKYADLQSVWAACRKPLSDNGLSVLQSPSTDGMRVSLETMLLHSSGQWVKGVVSVTAKEDSPQSVGSAITYLRRYALQSVAGVAPEDDDAEAAHGQQANGTSQARQPVPQTVSAPPKGYLDWLDDIKAASDEGTDRLQAAWKQSQAEYRSYLTTTAPKVWESIKAHAAKVSEPVHA
jgi:hypothetical protein